MPILQPETGTYIIVRTKSGLRTFSRLPAEHPFYGLVGRVAAEWAHLEHMLDLIIWELAQFDSQRASCVTGQMVGHAPRLRAIMALGIARGLNPKLIERANTLMGKIGGLAPKRNRIVHDAWYLADGADLPAQFKSISEKDNTFGLRPIDKTEIDKIIGDIRKRFDEVVTLRRDVQRELPTLR